MKYIDAEKLLAEIERRRLSNRYIDTEGYENELMEIITSLQQEQPEVAVVNIDNRIQYASIEGGIKAHAETYSFNMESQLFPQLTKEQQALWRKEIEQACISGGEIGVELAKDVRYKENQQPEVDLEREIIKYKVPFADDREYLNETTLDAIARHFYELGKNARKDR